MKKRSFVVFLLVFALMVSNISFAAIEDNNKAANDLLKASINRIKARNVSSNIVIKFSVDEKKAIEKGVFEYYTKDPKAMVKYLNTILKKFTYEYNVNLVTKEGYKDTFKLNGVTGAYYDKKDIIEGNFYFKPWEFGIGSDLLDGVYALNLKDMFSDYYINSKIFEIELDDYIKALTKTDKSYTKLVNNLDSYKNVLLDFYKVRIEDIKNDDISIKIGSRKRNIDVKKYKLKIKATDMIDNVIKLLEVARDDENLKAFVIDKMNDIEKVAIKNKDYEKFGVTLEVFKKGMNEVRETLDVYWPTICDSLINKYYDIYYTFDDTEYEVYISVDKKNVVRRVESDINIDHVVISVVQDFNAYGNDVKVEIDEKDTKHNLAEMFKSHYSSNKGEFMYEYVKCIIKIFESDGFEKLIKDLKYYTKILPSDEREEIKTQIDEAVNAIKMYLPMLLMNY
ncbi:hypothetical protein PV797_07260 [Clostridiaceae bacterium M8S5]|nr:hypothetical protein PV797_07260 [Clostridiaceae bacterium M8S5]